MKRFRVLYSAQAVDQLEALYLYIAEDTGPDRAAGYVDAIADYCDGLETFPIGDSVATASGRVCVSSDSGAG